MNILLTNYYGFDEGGAQRSTLLLAKALNESGMHTIIASTKKYPGIETHLFEPLLLPTPFFQKMSLVPFLKKIIEEKKINLVLAQGRLTSFAAVLAAKEKKIGSGVIFRDYWFACTKSTCLKPDMNKCTCSFSDIANSTPVHRILWEYYKISSIRKNLYLFDGVKKIAISNAVQKKLIEYNLSEPIKVIPNIVEIKPKGKMDVRKKYGIKGKIVLFVGRFSYEKGIFHMLNAAKMVLEKNKQANFLLVGNGTYFVQAKKRVTELGIEKNVFFTGEVSFEQIKDYYFQSDLVIVPSFMESFGRTAVEAFAAKKPVIASKIGGLTDIVDNNKNGFLVDPKSTNTWSSLILRLLENKQLSKKFGNNGFLKAKKFFSKKAVVKKILNEFEK